MNTQGKTRDDPEAIADADLSLRSISRLFSGALARFVVKPGERIRRCDWSETQLAARQRRLDRALRVEVTRRRCRLLHVEWTMRLNERVREQTAEYHLLSTIAARRDARLERRRGAAFQHVSVDSVVVVLSGRKKRWPRFGRYQTSRKGKPFTGVKFRIEAVYQRTVKELQDRGSLFWLVFVPLARDADEIALRRTIDKVRTEANEEEFREFVSTMLSMAQLKRDRPEFSDVIRSCAKKEAAVRHPWFVDGKEEGLIQGRLEGRLEALAYLFERQLGRSLREAERKRISLRLTNEGPEKLGAVVLDFSPEELAAWLEPRKTKKSRAA